MIFRVLFLSDKRIGILLLRGGLGNQLYQISALSYYSNKLDFIPLIYDFDISSVSGSYSEVGIDRWFTANNRPFILRGSLKLLFRVFLSINRRWSICQFWTERSLEAAAFKIPNVFLIRDSFQNCRYPLSLPKEFEKHFFIQDFDKHLGSTSNVVAMHIRLTDFLPENPFDADYYIDSLSNISKFPVERIDCFSDDINHAKSLVSGILKCNVEWPEDKEFLSSVEFLEAFSQYDHIIASRSSLCWWASFLAWKRNPNVYLLHPWDKVEDFKLASNI
jgi:hypothetical protein